MAFRLKPLEAEWKDAEKLVRCDRAPINVFVHMLIPSIPGAGVDLKAPNPVHTQVTPSDRKVVPGNHGDIHVGLIIERLQVLTWIEAAV